MFLIKPLIEQHA
jgi:REP element-mobilizing transposase RayT